MTLAHAWAAAIARLGLLDGSGALIRPALLPLAAPAVLCAVALLAAQGAAINWIIALCTLAASLLALAGIGALVSSRRSADATMAVDDTWSPLRPEAPGRTEEQRARLGVADAARQRLARRAGIALLALSALCALPVALRGPIAAALAGALAVALLALYGVDVVRRYVAPLDEIIAPLCLGPGLFSLTIVAQGQRMNTPDWLVAAALGGMAFAVIEARRLREAGAPSNETVGAHRTLATLIGARAAITLIAIALLASYALTLGVAAPRDGWPGALFALISLPTALIGFSGLAVSRYIPARRVAAQQFVWAYLWFGLALAFGLALTIVAERIINAIILALGG
jgi:1,4-dihydroxy-2-naphthoate octaprenyltransferase